MAFRGSRSSDGGLYGGSQSPFSIKRKPVGSGHGSRSGSESSLIPTDTRRRTIGTVPTEWKAMGGEQTMNTASPTSMTSSRRLSELELPPTIHEKHIQTNFRELNASPKSIPQEPTSASSDEDIVYLPEPLRAGYLSKDTRQEQHRQSSTSSHPELFMFEGSQSSVSVSRTPSASAPQVCDPQTTATTISASPISASAGQFRTSIGYGKSAWTPTSPSSHTSQFIPSTQSLPTLSRESSNQPTSPTSDSSALLSMTNSVKRARAAFEGLSSRDSEPPLEEEEDDLFAALDRYRKSNIVRRDNSLPDRGQDISPPSFDHPPAYQSTVSLAMSGQSQAGTPGYPSSHLVSDPASYSQPLIPELPSAPLREDLVAELPTESNHAPGSFYRPFSNASAPNLHGQGIYKSYPNQVSTEALPARTGVNEGIEGLKAIWQRGRYGEFGAQIPRKSGASADRSQSTAGVSPHIEGIKAIWQRGRYGEYGGPMPSNSEVSVLQSEPRTGANPHIEGLKAIWQRGRYGESGRPNT